MPRTFSCSHSRVRIRASSEPCRPHNHSCLCARGQATLPRCFTSCTPCSQPPEHRERIALVEPAATRVGVRALSARSPSRSSRLTSHDGPRSEERQVPIAVQRGSGRRSKRQSPGIPGGHGGIRTHDLSLRRGRSRITKARVSRFFRGEVDRLKCRKARLGTAKRRQTRHGAGFIRTPKH